MIRKPIQFYARSFNELDLSTTQSTAIFNRDVEYRGVWSYDHLYQHDYNEIKIYDWVGLGGVVNDMGGIGSNRITLEAAIIDGDKYGNLNLVSNEVEESQVQGFSLSQNYPNPFNPSTTIEVSIPYSSSLKLEVFDTSGKKIKTLYDGYKNRGNYSFQFNANNISSGVYFYKVTVGSEVSIKKMTLIK